MAASYAKLKNGDWGIRVQGGKPAKGDTVTVTTKDGKEKTETVAVVLWSGDGVHLCTIRPKESSGRSGGSSRGRRTGCSCGSIEGEIRDTDCWTCKHDAE